jgi:hypothetical protein
MFLLLIFFYFIGFFFLSLECFSNWKKMLLYLRQALLFLFLNFGHPALLRAPTNLSALSWQKLTKKLGYSFIGVAVKFIAIIKLSWMASTLEDSSTDSSHISPIL